MRRPPCLRVAGAVGRARSAGATVIASIPDAGIEHGIAEVNEQIDQHIRGRKDKDDALNDRVVSSQYRIYCEAAEPGYREHRLGDHDTGDKPGDPDADD